jgi:transcriptional regulator with XRE-family HTH domain
MRTEITTTITKKIESLMTTSNHNISLLDQLLESITPIEQNRTNNRMLLAARIADVMREKGISQKALAEKLGKKHSVITLWLSGTHNFTCETLSDIEIALDIKLFQFTEPQPIIKSYFIVVNQKVQVENVKPEHQTDFNNELFSTANFSIPSPKRQKMCN